MDVFNEAQAAGKFHTNHPTLATNPTGEICYNYDAANACSSFPAPFKLASSNHVIGSEVF